MPKKRVELSDQIRRAVRASGRSCYSICRWSGLYQSSLSRFMRGERGLSMQSLDILAYTLKLNLRSPRRKQKNRGQDSNGLREKLTVSADGV